MMLSIAVLLAGCAGGNGDHEDETYTCPNGTVLNLEDFPEHHNATFNPASKCPGGGSGSATTTTTQAPNIPPVLVVKTFDSMGNETKVTLLGGNLTFSAEGSTDPDGQISGIAVTVTDSNTTRTASLYDAVSGQFKSATFMFDRPGVVNVTVAMVDDRAGFTINQTNVYVNHMQTLGPDQYILAGGNNIPTNSACNGGDPLVNAQYYKSKDFTVHAGVTYIEATASGGRITICDPADTPVSNSGTSVVTNEGEELPAPQGIESYSVSVFSTAPYSTISIEVLVHYEPREAAAAE